MILLEFLRLLTMGFMAMGAADGGPAPPAVPQASITDPSFSIAGRPGIDDIEFGDNSSPRAHDSACDDPRFTGPGMATRFLDNADLRADASDCEAAWRADRLTVYEIDTGSPITEPVTEDGIDFGIDANSWANDGECDDPRFTGPGMTTTSLLDSDIRADASDCLAAWRDGRLHLRDGAEAATGAITEDGIDFGDDSSTWSNDGECDDPRFTGPGMTTTSLLDSDIRADASDCLAAWRAGTLTLIGTDDSTRSAPAKSIAN